MPAWWPPFASCSSRPAAPPCAADWDRPRAERRSLDWMFLVCSKRCGGKLFRELFTEVEVDASGGDQSHQIVQPGYLCLNFGSPAIDLREVPNAIPIEADEEAGPLVSDILCPLR